MIEVTILSRLRRDILALASPNSRIADVDASCRSSGVTESSPSTNTFNGASASRTKDSILLNACPGTLLFDGSLP